MEDNFWYDINDTLSHNCLFNIVIGNRGCGKTYSSKKRAVNNFLKNGKKFIYLRRYDTELDKVKDTIFNDIVLNGEFQGHSIEFKADEYLLDGNVFGYAMALTKTSYYKSLSYPDVSLIIYDEFLIDEGGTTRYLKNEVLKFLDFYETIDRMRDETVVFFLANAISFINPYTIYWNLRLPFNKNIAKKEDLVLLQLVMNECFIAKKKKTRFGRLVDGTQYGDYAINNKFLRDSPEFIEKKTGNCHNLFKFKYNGVFYGVWATSDRAKMFVSEDIDPFCKLSYSLTQDDHTPNTMLLKRLNQALLFKRFIDYYKNGCVYFETQKIKNIVSDVIKLCIT